MAEHICWWCAHAFREDSSKVACNRDYQFRSRTYSCPYWLECPKKKYVSSETLKL